MITSEDLLFDIIPSDIRPLVFDHLLDAGRLNLYLYRKLSTYAGLRTVDDLCQQYVSIQDFITRNSGTGKRTADELMAFLMNFKEDVQPVTNSDLQAETTLTTWSPEVTLLSLKQLHQQRLISNRLFNKLCRDTKLQTVGDFVQQFRSIQEFQRKTQGIGDKVVSELTVFFENLSKEPASYLEAVEQIIEQSKNIYLPLDYCSTYNIIENFEKVVVDVEQMLAATQNKTDHHYIVILKYYFVDKSINSRYTLEDVGILTQLSRERVRQLKNKVKTGFIQLLQGCSNDLLTKCFLFVDLKEQINALFRRLKNRFKYIATEIELLRFFEEEQIFLKDLNVRAINLLFEIYGISQCGKSETGFTQANLYSMDPDFDQKPFMVTGKLVLDTLKDEVVLLTRNVLINRINKNLKKVKDSHTLKSGKIPHQYIDIALAQLPEVETLYIDSAPHFQISYPYLTSIAAKIERILFELGGWQSFSQIMPELQTRADRYQLDDNYEEQTVRSQIRMCNGRIQSHGKRGLYKWISPEAPQTSGPLLNVDLVKAAIKTKGEPATLREIEQYVNAHLTAIDTTESQNLKSTSGIISHLIRQGKLIRLQPGLYILKSWEHRYTQQVNNKTSRNPKGKIQAELITILSASPDKTMARRVLSRRLLEAGYSRPTITAVIRNSLAIELFKENNKVQVRLRDNHQDFLRPRQEDQVLKGITDLLSNTKDYTLPLPIVVKKISNDFSLSNTQKPIIYKIISANPHLFKKSELTGNQKLLTLLAAPKSFDVSFDPSRHWTELKNKLIAKLNSSLSGTLTHSLDETLDLFFNIAMLPSDEADLEALDLLPGFIWKFFSGMADEHFEHSLVREIATSIEPYLLKILCLTSPAQYKTYQNDSTKGLYRIKNLLSRVQFEHSQRLRTAFFTAKRTRDAAAHTAQSWSSVNRSERVLACLIQLLYSVDCYFERLRSFTAPIEVTAP